MVKFPSLSDRLAALTPPERPGDSLARPDNPQADAARVDANQPRQRAGVPARPVSSPTEVERAQENVRAALDRFGREAPGRRSSPQQPQPPGHILDLKV